MGFYFHKRHSNSLKDYLLALLVLLCFGLIVAMLVLLIKIVF
jgi:hypothetical protein